MIAPFYVPVGNEFAVLWTDVGTANALNFKVFYAMGDYGLYCPIKWERL